ncbi:MarR family winged helix-turn-helix transcriptional regulator [Microbacter sp. GSS18]|nr:MarR family winged helix-turn-helix transcriptional regulator [Microbacter sp. GSS18]
MAEVLGLTAALVRSAGLVSDVCAQTAAEHGLTTQQAQLLCVIAAHDVTMAQLGPMLRIAKSSTTGLVDRAEEAGLVRRVADSDDRRSQRVCLTPQGDRLGAAYRASVSERVGVLLAGIPAEQLETLQSALSRVVLVNSARATWPGTESAA